jgi:hypothetical protein
MRDREILPPADAGEPDQVAKEIEQIEQTILGLTHPSPAASSRPSVPEP